MQFIPDVMGRSVEVSDDQMKRSLIPPRNAPVSSAPTFAPTTTTTSADDPIHNAVLAAVGQYLSTGEDPHPAFAASSSNFLSRPPLRRAHHPSFSMTEDRDTNDRPHETVPIPLSVSDRYSFQSHYMRKLSTFYEQHFDAENRISGCGAACSVAERSGAFSSLAAGSQDMGGKRAASKRVSSVVDLIKRRWKPGMPLGVFTATYNTAMCNSMLPKRNTKASPHVAKDNKRRVAAEPFAASEDDQFDELDSFSMSDAPSSSSSLDHTGSYPRGGASHLTRRRGEEDGPLNNNPSMSKPTKRKDVTLPSAKAKDSKAKKPPKGDASFNTMDLEEIRSLLVRPNAHVIVLATQEHGPYVSMGATWNEKASKNKYRWGRKEAERRLHKIHHRHNTEKTHFEEFDAKVRQAMRRRVATNRNTKTIIGQDTPKTGDDEVARSRFASPPIVHSATGTFTTNPLGHIRGKTGGHQPRRSDVTTLSDDNEEFSDAGSAVAGSSGSMEEGRAQGDHPSAAVHEDYSTLPHHLVFNPDSYDPQAGSPLKGGDNNFPDASNDKAEEVLICVGDLGAGAASREDRAGLPHPPPQSRLLPPSGLSDVSSDDDIFYSAARKASGGVLIRTIPSLYTRSSTLLGVGGKRLRPTTSQPKLSPSPVDGCRVQNPVALRRRLYRYTNLRSAVGEVAALLDDNRESMTRYSRNGALLDPKEVRAQKGANSGGWCCTSDNYAVDGKPTMALEASTLTKQAVPPPRRAMPLLRWASTTASRAAANEIHDAASVTGGRRAHELMKGDALRSQTTTSFVSVSEGGGRSSNSSFSAPTVLYTKRDLLNKKKEATPAHAPTPSELNAADNNPSRVATEEASEVATTSHLLPHYYKDVLSYIDDQCRRSVKGFILTNSSEGIHGVAGGMGCMSGGDVGEAHELLVSSSSSSASTGGPSRCSSCERAADAKEAAEELEATGPSIAEQARQRQLRMKQLGLVGVRGAKRDTSHSSISKDAITTHRSSLYGLLDPYVLPNPRDGVFCSLHNTKIIEKAIATKRRRDAKAHRFNVSRTKENRALEDIHSGGSLPFANPTDLSPEVDVAGASLYHRRWQKDIVLGGCLNNYKGNRQLQRIALRRAEVVAASAGASAAYIASSDSAPIKWSTGGGRNAAVIALARRALGVRGNATPASAAVEARRAVRSSRTAISRSEGTWEDVNPTSAGPSAELSPSSVNYAFPKFLGADSVHSLNPQSSPHMSASSHDRSTAAATTIVPPAPRISSLLHHYTLVTSNSMTSMHIGVYVRTCDVLPYIKRSAIIGGGGRSGDPSKAAGKGYSGAPDGLKVPLGNPRTATKLEKASTRAKVDVDMEPLDHLSKADSNSHYFPFNAGSDPKQVFREQEANEEDAGLKEGCTTIKTGMLGGMVGNKGGVAVEITLDMVRKAEDDTAFYQTAVKMRMLTAERETVWRRRRLDAENKARISRNRAKRVAKEQSVKKWMGLIEQVRKGAPIDSRHHHTNATLLSFPSDISCSLEIPTQRTLLQFARSEGLGDPACKGDSSSDEDTMPSSDFSDSCSSDVSSSDSLPSEQDLLDDRMGSSTSRRVGNALQNSLNDSAGDIHSGDVHELFGPLANSARDNRPPSTHPTPIFTKATPNELRRGGRGAPPLPPLHKGDMVTLPLTRAQKIRYRAKRAHIKALEHNRRQEEQALLSSLVPHYHSSNNLVGLAAIARLRRLWKASERSQDGCKPTALAMIPPHRDASSGAFVATAEISGMFDSPAPAMAGKRGVQPLDTDFSPSTAAATTSNTADVSPVGSGSHPTHASSPNRPPRAPRSTSSPLPQNPSSPTIKMPTFDAIVPLGETLRLHTDALYRHLEDELATIGHDEALLSQSDTDGESDELNESARTINPRPKRVAQQDVPGAKLRAAELVYRDDRPPATGVAGVLSSSIQQQLYEDPVAREERRVWARLYHHRCYLQFVRCRLKAAMLELDRTGGLTPAELDITQDILAKRLKGISLQRITCVEDGLSEEEKQRRDQEDVVVSFLFSHESPALADMQPIRSSSYQKGGAVSRFMVTSFPFGAAASSGIYMFGTRAAELRLGGMNRKYLLDTTPQVEGSLTGNTTNTDSRSNRALKRGGVSGGNKEVIRSVRVQDGDDPGATILTPPSLHQISLLPTQVGFLPQTAIPMQPIPSMGGADSSSLRDSSTNQIETFYNRRNMSVHRERQDRFAASVGDTVSATMSTVRRPPGGGGGGMVDSIPFTASRPRGGGLVAFVDAPELPSQTPPSAGLSDEGPHIPDETDSPRDTAAPAAASLTPFTLPPPEPTTELTLLFIGAHLTAHDHHLEKRNHDYWRIVTLLSTGTRASTNPGGLGYTAGFVRSRTARRLLERRLRQLHREQVAAMEAGKPEIKASVFHHARDATEEPDACFFMGDLNYRLRGSNKGLQRLVAQATAPPRVSHTHPPQRPAATQPATPASVVTPTSTTKPPSTSNRQTAVSFSPGEGAIPRALPASRGFEAKSILQSALSVAAANRRQQMGTDSDAIPVSAEALGDALASSLHRANQEDIAHLVAELKSHKQDTAASQQPNFSPRSSSSFDSSAELSPEVREALAKILEEREWSAHDDDAWSDDEGTSPSSSSEDEAAIVIRAETLAANDQLLLEMSGKAPRLSKMRNKLAAQRIKEAQAKGEDLEAAARGYLHKNPAYNYDQRLVFNGFKEAGRLLFAPSYKFKLHPMSGEEGSVGNMDAELSKVWRGMVGEYFRGADVPVRYDPTANPQISRKDSVGSARRELYSLLTDVRGCVTAILAQRDQYTHRHPNIEARASAAMRRGDFELVDELLSDIVFAGLTRVMCGILHSEHTNAQQPTTHQRSPNNSFHFFQANERLSSFRRRTKETSRAVSIGSVSGAAGRDPDDFMPLTFVQALSEMSLWPQKVAEQQAAAFAKYARSLRRSSRASIDSSVLSPTSGAPQLLRHRSNLRRGSRVLAPLASPEMSGSKTEREVSTVSISRRGAKTQEQTAQEKAYLHVVREVIMRDAATLLLRLVVEHVRCDSVGYGGSAGGPHPSKSSLHGSLLLSAGVFCSYFRDHPTYKSVPYLCTPHWHSQPMLYDDKRLPSYCDRILVRVNNDQTVGEALGRGIAGNVGRHTAPVGSPNSSNAPLSSASGSGDAPASHAVSLPIGAPEDRRPAVVIDTVAYTSVPRTSTSDHMPVAAYFVVHAPFYFSPVSKDVHKVVSATRHQSPNPPTEDDMWASACSAPATTKFTFRKRYWATPYLPPFQPRPQRDTLFSSLLWVYYRNQVLLAQWEDDQEAYYEAQERALGAVIGDTANRLLR